MTGSRIRRQVRRMPAEKRVSDIMAAAHAVLAERGANEAFMSEVAERAGVVEGSIYRFFSNKRDLVERVVEHWYEDMLADYAAQFEGVRGVRNQLRFIIYHHLSSIKKEPALSRIVFQELRPATDYRASRIFELNQAYTQRIVDVVRAAVKSGEFRDDVSPTLARDMIFGSIEHRTWAYLRNEGDFDAGKTADAITDFVYRALCEAANEPSDRVAAALSRLERVADRLADIAGVPETASGVGARKKASRQTLK